MTSFFGKSPNSGKILLLILIPFTSSFFTNNVRADTELVYSLEDLTVTTRTNIYQSDPMTKIYSLSEESNGAISDVGDVVRNISGVSIPYDISASDSLVPYTNRGFTSYKIRGLGGNRISILVDGIRQPPEYKLSGGMGRTFFDPSVYESVSIKKGTAASSSQSDSLAGSVNFTSGSIELSTFDQSDYFNFLSRLKYMSVSDSLNLLQKSQYRSPNLEMNANTSFTRGNERKNDNGAIPADPMDYDQRHLFLNIKGKRGNFNYKIDAEKYRYTSDVELNHTEDFAYTTPSPFSSSDVLAKGTDINQSNNANYRERISFDFLLDKLGPIDDFGCKLYLQNSNSRNFNKKRDTLIYDPASSQWQAFNLDEDQLTQRSTIFNDIGFDNDLYGINLSAVKNTHLIIPYSSSYKKLPVVFSSGWFYDIENGNNVFNRSKYVELNEYVKERDGTDDYWEDVASPNYFDPSKLYRSETFIDAHTISGNLSCTLGLRYNAYRIDPDNNPEVLSNSFSSARSDYKNNSLTKSILVKYAAEKVGSWVSYSEGVKNPSLENYVGFFNHNTFYYIPNPNLEEEKARSFELGWYYNSRLFGLDYNLYFTNYDGFYEIVDVGEINGTPARQVQNIDDSSIEGYEAEINIYLGEIFRSLDGLTLNVIASGVESLNKETGEGLDTVDPTQIIYKLQYEDIMGDFGANFILRRNLEKKNISSNWAYFIPPSSSILDFSSFFHINDRSIITFSIRNILNEKYWLWPNAGRVVHAFSENEELSVMPGRNFLLSYSYKF